MSEGLPNPPLALGAWIAIGAGVGTALGAAMNNIGLWLAIGVALGVVIGAATGGSRPGGS